MAEPTEEAPVLEVDEAPIAEEIVDVPPPEPAEGEATAEAAPVEEAAAVAAEVTAAPLTATPAPALSTTVKKMAPAIGGLTKKTPTPTPKLKPADPPKPPPEPPKAPDVVEFLWQAASGSFTIDDATVTAALSRVAAAVAGGAAKPIGGYAVCKSIAESGSSRVVSSITDKTAVGNITIKPSPEDRLAILAAAVKTAPTAIVRAWTPRDTVNVVQWVLSLIKAQSQQQQQQGRFGPKQVPHTSFTHAAAHAAFIVQSLSLRGGKVLERNPEPTPAATDADLLKGNDAWSSLARLATAVVAVCGSTPEIVVSVHSAIAAAFLQGKSEDDFVRDLTKAKDASFNSTLLLATPIRRGTPTPNTSAAASAPATALWLRYAGLLPWAKVIVAERLLHHFFSAGRGDEMPEAVISFLSDAGSSLGPKSLAASTTKAETLDRSTASTPGRNQSTSMSSRVEDDSVVLLGEGASNAVGALHWVARAVTEVTPARWLSLIESRDSSFLEAILEVPRFIGVTPFALWQAVPVQGALDVATFLSGLWTQLKYSHNNTQSVANAITESLRVYDPEFGVRALIRHLTSTSDSFDARTAIALTLTASVPGALCADLLRDVQSPSQTLDDASETSGFGLTPHRDPGLSVNVSNSFATPKRRTTGGQGLSTSRLGQSTLKKIRPELAHLIVGAVNGNAELVSRATGSLLAATGDGVSALMVASVYSSVATDDLFSPLLNDERAVSALQLALQSNAVHVMHNAVLQRALDALSTLGQSTHAAAQPARIAIGMTMQSSVHLWTAAFDPTMLLMLLIESNTAERSELAALLAQSVTPHLQHDVSAWHRHSVVEWISVFHAAWPTEYASELLPLVVTVLDGISQLSAAVCSNRFLRRGLAVCFEILDAVGDDKFDKATAQSLASSVWRFCVNGGNGYPEVVIEAASLVKRFERSREPLVREATVAAIMKNGDGASLRNDSALLCHSATESHSHDATAAVCTSIQRAIDLGMRLPAAHLEKLRFRLLANPNASVEERSQALLALVPTPNLIQVADLVNLLTSAVGTTPVREPAAIAATILVLRAVVTATFGSAQAASLSKESVEVVGTLLKRGEVATICGFVSTLATTAWSELVAASASESGSRTHIRAVVGATAAHPSACPRTGLVVSVLSELGALCSTISAVTGLFSEMVRSKTPPPTATVRSVLSSAVLMLETSTSLCNATLSRASKGSLAAVTRSPLLLTYMTGLCAASLDLGRAIKRLGDDSKSDAYVEAGVAPLALVSDRTAQLVKDVALGTSRFVLADINGVASTLDTGLEFFDFLHLVLTGLEDALSSGTTTTSNDDDVHSADDNDGDGEDQHNASFVHVNSEFAVNRRKLCDVLLLESNLWESSSVFVDFALLAAQAHSRVEATLSHEYRAAISTHQRQKQDPGSVSMRRSSSAFSDNVDLDVSATSFSSSAATSMRDHRGVVSVTQVPVGHFVDWTAVACRAVAAILHLAAVHGGSAHHHLDHHIARLVDRLSLIVRHLLITGVVDVAGHLWQKEGLSQLLQFRDPGLRASSALHASGTVTRLPWHHFWAVTLQLVRGSLIAAVSCEEREATRVVAAQIARKLLSVSRIRYVVETPVTGPTPPERTQGQPKSHADSQDAHVITPWTLEEGSITCDLVAKLTASRLYSPLAEELRIATFLSAKVGLRDVQERRLESIRHALAPFFARHHHRVTPGATKRSKPEQPQGESSGSSSDDSESDTEVDVALHREHHHHLIMARLALVKVLGSSLALGPVLTPAPYMVNAPSGSSVPPPQSPPQHPDLVAPRRPEKAYVSPSVLLEFVRSCFRVVAAITRSTAQSADHAETPLSKPVDGSPLGRKTTVGGSIAGGTTADTTLGVNSVEVAAQSIELAVIIFVADSQRWVNTASVLRLKEFRDTAEQLSVLMHKARGDALEFASYADTAEQALQEVRDLLTLQQDTTGSKKR